MYGKHINLSFQIKYQDITQAWTHAHTIKLPQENTLPTWLLPCTCDAQRCHCNATFKPDIFCIIGHPYNSPRSETPTTEITIQFIEFTYYNDIFIAQTRKRKTTKHQPLINNVVVRGWNVAPLMVLVACARATTHIPTMKEIETKLKLPTLKLLKKKTHKQQQQQQINIIALQYAHLILVHKGMLYLLPQ